ncbi:MAG TPA: SRPBCC domain-containing protein [Acidimicrobiia bacterium]|nr:SRPBCC domain-containing protein [Acidimicrobiia bacterium]
MTTTGRRPTLEEEPAVHEPIEREISIDAPVDVVWRTVTEPEEISRWFAHEVDLVAEPGYEGSLTFVNENTERATTFNVTVQSVDPERTFSYRWLHDTGDEPRDGNSVLVVFTLTPEGDGTRLRVVETGVERMAWPADERDRYVREHLEGWSTFLGRLRSYAPRSAAR